MLCDSIFKHFNEVVSVNGEESTILHLYIYTLLLCNQEDPFSNQIDKLFKSAKDILYNLAWCPLETIISLQFVRAMLSENELLHESEKDYLVSFIHYLSVYGDPRGRGNHSHQFSSILMWKLSMISQYYGKIMDAEFCEEILDAIIYNQDQSTIYC